MIVLSVGMPRAGSGWHYNLIHDLMHIAGASEASEIRAQFHLEHVLTEVNCNIGVLSARRLALVSWPTLQGHTFVIKAHSRPTFPFRILRLAGMVRASYIYRDPRDAMLSAMDYGRRALDKGRPNAFSHLTDFEVALDFIMSYVRIWDQWMREPGVLVARYEDLLQDYDAEACKLVDFLGLDSSSADIQGVIERLRPAAAEGRQGTHFFKGRVGRFRDVFTAHQQDQLRQQLEPYLPRMGYAA